MKIYKAREGATFKKQDAQAIGEFIEQLPIKKPEIILEASKNQDSPLHSYIEWNNKKAGEAYRLHQVRDIVSHITIVFIDVPDNPPLRAFYSVTPKGDTESQYVSIKVLQSDDYLLNQIIERAYVELNNWVARYRQYEKLKPVVFAVEEIIGDKILV